MSNEPTEATQPTTHYYFIPPYQAPCTAYGCNALSHGLCWRCQRPACVDHLYLVRWSAYSIKPMPHNALAVIQGKLLHEETGSLLCAECARKLPDIGGRGA